MAVAVVAGSNLGGNVGLAEGHGFPVIGIAIMLQPILVAFPAALVAGHLEMAVLGGLDFVGGVAIGADGSTLVALGEELPMDAFVIGLFNANVAFAAGLSDIGMVDRRFTVHGSFDVVDAVAIIAGGGDDEAHLEQGAPVDAVHVLRRRLGQLHLVFLRQPGITVAFGAGPGKVQFEDWGVALLRRKDVVGAVAIPATGGTGSAQLVARAMDTSGVVLAFLVVALDATGRLRRNIIIRVLGSDVGMAVGT